MRAVVKPRVWLVLLMLGMLVAACGGGDDGAAANDASGGADDAALRQLFADRGCAECHGAEGEGTDQPRSKLAGTRLIIQQFETRTRNGKGSAMPGYTPEQISDEEIRQIWEWLREKE